MIATDQRRSTKPNGLEPESGGYGFQSHSTTTADVTAPVAGEADNKLQFGRYAGK